MEKLSKKEARQIVLSAQKLDGSLKTPHRILEHLGYVQIDTISVVERAHHHIFWSRNQQFRPSDLDRLIQQRKAFEYWTHAASFLPMRDYRYSLFLKKKFSQRASSWFPKDIKLMKKVLKRIKEEGPLGSKDFENKKAKSNGWWDWKPAKKALERLFIEGQLEISHRQGFQKVYDLPERVIPDFVNITSPSETEYIHYLILRTLQQAGLATLNEIAHLAQKSFKDKVQKELDHWVENKKVVPVTVQNSSLKYYALKKSLDHVSAPKEVHIFSPFDNLTIHRQRLKDIFDFDYQIECYVPQPKRKFGYFCLPILSGDRFVGRIDLKAHRGQKKLEILSLHSEKAKDQKTLAQKIKPALEAFALLNNCSRIVKNS